MSVCFVVPAHGRLALAALCFQQLARTSASLAASVLVVAEDENLELAAELGFETLRRPNYGLGRRFNDGFEQAAKLGADYLVPLGSDDWVDAELFRELPDERSVFCFRACSLVSEDGSRLAKLRIPYQGGIGMRIMPAALLAYVGHRPAGERLERGVDTSIIGGLRRASDARLRAGLPDVILEYRESDPLQIVDFKSPAANLNTYRACADYCAEESRAPFAELAGFYPGEAVAAMQALYLQRRAVPA